MNVKIQIDDSCTKDYSCSYANKLAKVVNRTKLCLRELDSYLDDNNAKLDKNCKFLFSKGLIQAYILKFFIPEYKDMNVLEIEKEVLKCPADDRIDMLNCKVEIPDFSTMEHDILYKLYSNNGVEGIFSMKIQGYGTDYDAFIDNVLLYNAPLLYIQRHKTFDCDYETMIKCFNFWVNINSYGKYKGIYRLIDEELIPEEQCSKKERKLSIMIVFPYDDIDCEHLGMRMLNIIFSEKHKGTEKIELLEKMGINLKAEERRWITNMCTYSSAVEARGMAKGIVIHSIMIGFTKKRAISDLMKIMKCDEETANMYYDEYSNQ